MQDLESPMHQAAQKWLAEVQQSLNSDTVQNLLTDVATLVHAGRKAYRDAAEKASVRSRYRRDCREERARLQQRLQVLVPALRILQAYRQQLRRGQPLKHPDALAVHLLSLGSGTHRRGITHVLSQDEHWNVRYFSTTEANKAAAFELLRAHPEVFGTLPDSLRGRFPSEENLHMQQQLALRTSLRKRVLEKVTAAGILDREELKFLRGIR